MVTATQISKIFYQRRAELEGVVRYRYLIRTKIFEKRDIELLEFDNYFGANDKMDFVRSIRSHSRRLLDKASGERKEYLNKYPWVMEYEQILLREMWLKSIFGIEKSHDLIDNTLIEELACDRDGIVCLSTHAINTIIIAQKKRGRELIPLSELVSWLEESRKYGSTALVYYFTHCVIATSGFYTQNLSTNEKLILSKAAKVVEREIEANFDLVTLDAKIEFMLVAKICGYQARLGKKIDVEIAGSLHSEGYIDDPRAPRHDINQALHRNMLYLGWKIWQR